MNAFERQVADEVVASVRPPRSVDAMAIVRTATARSPKWTSQSVFGAVGFAVAGIIVALFGGLLLAGVLTQPSGENAPVGASTASPEATQTPFVLSSELPDDVDAGVIDTPAGQARWIHLSGDTTTLPKLGTALPWPSGLAVFAPSNRASVAPHRLFVTPNGIQWQVTPLPAAAPSNLDPIITSMSFDGGDYWLANTCDSSSAACQGLTQLWRSSETSIWEEVDLGGLGAFTPSSFGGLWGAVPAIAPPVSTGELTMSVLTGSSNFADLSALFHERPVECDSGPLRSIDPDRYQLDCDEGKGPVMRFEETDTGLQVIDDEAGEELGEIAGADLTHLERLSTADDFSFQRVVRIFDDEVVPVEVPWSPYDQAQLFGVDDQVFAYVHHIDGGQAKDVTAWRTDDGSSWSELGRPGFLRGLPVEGEGHTTLSVGPSFVAAVHPDVARIGWETRDGTSWTAIPESPEGTYLHRLESGWFATDGGAIEPVGDQWWMLVDDAWVSLAELGMERAEDWCTVRPTAVARTTIFTASDDDCFMDEPGTSGPVEMWVLSLDSPE